MNKNLLLQVADHIEKHPLTYSQGTWAWTNVVNLCYVEVEDIADVIANKDISDVYACNTKACVAGWACLLSDISRENYLSVVGCETLLSESSINSRAQRLLGLEGFEAEILFHEHWMRGATTLEVAHMLRAIANGDDEISEYDILEMEDYDAT